LDRTNREQAQRLLSRAVRTGRNGPQAGIDALAGVGYALLDIADALRANPGEPTPADEQR
jgi:hypothetical protein